MLLKRIDGKGQAVPMTPAEALYHAVVGGLKGINSQEFVYWTPKGSVKASSPVAFFTHPDGVWEATAEGEFMLGKTRVRDDQFFDAKKATFRIGYKSSKDEIGLPDITVTSFSYELVQTNPSRASGPVDNTQVEAPLVTGELTPERTGR